MQPNIQYMRRLWHLICVGIHILLNIIYWDGAVEYGIVGPEIVVTVIHGLLVALHLASFAFIQNMPTAMSTISEKIEEQKEI